MARRVDILIIGGGIYGAATAYQAVRRGLSVLLVERADFGSGSSSNSLKILHGGLRYLQSLDLGRSLESIRARRELLRLAPQLTRPLRCRMDMSGRPQTFPLALEVGLRLNDLVSIDRNREVADSHHLPASGGGRWHDAIALDTERLLMSLLHTAVDCGEGRCEVRNYTEVDRLVRRGGRVIGAEISGVGEVEVGCVVRCVGAYRSDRPFLLSMNLLVDELPMSAMGEAIALRHPIDGRNVFVVPWRGRSMIGTWDRPYPFDPTGPLRVEDDWVDEFLGWAAPVHLELRDLRRPDVRLIHAGLQPAEGAGMIVPRRHYEIMTDDDGVMNVLGVKYTTALPVAREAVKLVMTRLGLPHREIGHPLGLINHHERLSRYQAEAPGRATPIRAGHPLTRGAVEYAVDRERARTLADVLLRRTGVAAAGYPGAEVVGAVADIMQPMRAWSDADREEEVAALGADFHFAGNTPDRGPESPENPGEIRA